MKPELIERLALWRGDMAQWCREVTSFIPDNWQEEGSDALCGKTTIKKRIAMKACKGPGKTAWLANSGLWFLSNFPFSKIVCTSITGDNLRDNLWAEFKKWMRNSPFLEQEFIWTKERIFHKDHPEEWWISARRWSKDADPEQQANALAGIHADYVLFILDEAGGIPDSVAAAAEGGLATGKFCRLVIAGNPTHTSGPLYRACTSETDLWWTKSITGDPRDPSRAPRVDLQWAEEQIRKYGRKSPYVMVNVLGIFPTGAIDTVLGMSDFEEAFARWYIVGGKSKPNVLGCDIARYGSDINAICHRTGDRVHQFFEWQGMDTDFTSNRIAELALDLEIDEIRVDDVGVGGGVTDNLKVKGFNVVGINVGESPVDDPESHLNLRSELYADLQEKFVNEEIRLAPEVREDTSLIAEGTTLKIRYTDRNKRGIEPKEIYKKRTKRSPNYLDALVLAFSDRVSAESVARCSAEQSQFRGALNPYTSFKRQQRKSTRLTSWTGSSGRRKPNIPRNLTDLLNS